MTPSQALRGAFSLVEVTLALGIAAFGLVTLMALLPIGLKSNQSSIEQTEANEIISAIGADLRSTPPSVPRGQQTTTQRFKIPIPANPVKDASGSFVLYFSDDGFATSLQPASRHRVVINFIPNVLPTSQGSSSQPDTSREATMGVVDVYWPAAASNASAASHAPSFIALDRN